MTVAQAGISVVTGEGEKTLTIQNAQGLKARMNAEREALKAVKDPASASNAQEGAFVGHNQTSMSQEQDEGNFISEEGYQEQPQVEVACLDDWERLHLGE